MKVFLLSFFVLISSLSYAQQDLSKNSYDVYIVYKKKSFLFSKMVEIKQKEDELVQYELSIPNPKQPWCIFYFDKKDELNVAIKGANGGAGAYNFSFIYYSKKNQKFFIRQGDVPEFKLTLPMILNSNIEMFAKVLKRAENIFILELSNNNCYVAREVIYSKITHL